MTAERQLYEALPHEGVVTVAPQAALPSRGLSLTPCRALRPSAAPSPLGQHQRRGAARTSPTPIP